MRLRQSTQSHPPFTTYDPVFWQSDGTFNYGVEDPNYVPNYTVSEEKERLELWMSQECSALFTLDGEPTYTDRINWQEAPTVPIPANYRLYDNLDGVVGYNPQPAEDIKGKYVELMRADSFDSWEAEAMALITACAVDYSEIERYINTVGTDSAYYSKEALDVFNAVASECKENIDVRGKVHINLY